MATETTASPAPAAPGQATPVQATPARWPLVALFLGSSMLAFGPLLVRLADVGPVASAFWRMALAAPVLIVVALVLRTRETDRVPFRALPWGVAATAGAFFGGDLIAWHLGIVRTSMANATLFANTTAFMLAGWALLVRREKPARTTMQSLALAGAGALLLFGSSAQLGTEHLLGDVLSLVAAALYTGYLLTIMRLRGKLSTATVLAMSTVGSVIVLLPAGLLEPAAFWPGDWRPVMALAVSSQLLGQGLMVFASGRLPAFIVGLGLLVQPLVSAAAGWAIFGEALGPVELLGAGMIAAALVLIRR